MEKKKICHGILKLKKQMKSKMHKVICHRSEWESS